MDENPYRAPAEDEGPKAPPAKRSDFLDPVKNLTMLIVVVTVLSVGFLLAMKRAHLADKVHAEAERENARIGAP